MHGSTHVILSWMVAKKTAPENLGLRRIITLSGIAPDIDVLIYAGAFIYYDFDIRQAFEVHAKYHHVFTHGLFFALLTFVSALLLARIWCKADWLKSFKTALVSLSMSLLHCLFDLIGSGPGWGIFPFWPINKLKLDLTWSWRLDAWPNILITLLALFGALAYLKFKGSSPVEILSKRLDRRLAKIFQSRPTKD